MLNKNKHRMIMINILKDIYSSEIWKYLAFKWWTASYLFYNLDRFSTDLDFDLLENKNIDFINKKFIEILVKYWKIKKWNNLILSYWEKEMNIKIDINRNIWKNNSYEIINFFWINIKIQDKATIFTNKLIALTERNTNRDIFDVNFFFNNLFDINEKLIYERSWKTIKWIFLDIKNKLQNLETNYKILFWLWEVLDEKQKIDVKKNLIRNLISSLEIKINFDFD